MDATTFILAGGTVYMDVGPERCDLLIADGKIAAIGQRTSFPQHLPVLEVDGLNVLPGIIDFHVHVDDLIGGRYLADTYRSGSKAAVLNGITTLFSFVTQPPGSTLGQALKVAHDKVEHKCYCDVGFHLTPTSFTDADWEDIQSLIQRGYHTFKFYTTYRKAGLFQDYESLRKLFDKFASFGARVLVHCEDESILSKAESAARDLTDPFAHTTLRPPEAELAAIARVAELAEATGAAVHIVHVSTADGAQTIQAKRKTAALSCETAPHYLFLNDSALAGTHGQQYLCSPPLRSEANRRELEQLAADGVFDIFATDHCAFSAADKLRAVQDIREVPNGIAGVGALVPLTYDLLMRRHSKNVWSEMCLRLAKNPAILAGVYPRKGSIREGADADLVVVSDYGMIRPVCSSYSDSPEPYASSVTRLDVHSVFIRGELTVRNNQLAEPEHPIGQVLWPM